MIYVVENSLAIFFTIDRLLALLIILGFTGVPSNIFNFLFLQSAISVHEWFDGVESFSSLMETHLRPVGDFSPTNGDLVFSSPGTELGVN
ncbi:hypothetical protein X975_23975, partial [Stegodyphus mimosarum]